MVQSLLAPESVVDGRYVIRRRLGAGALGSVFEAHDRVFDRAVALKALRFESSDALAVFRREFTLLCACAHPRLARPYDFARTRLEGEPLTYYTSELVRGITLAEHAIHRAADETLGVLLDALDALGWLHARGIVHGDFKPDNVLVREDETGVLIDLSAARRIHADAEGLSGTAHYLAPELLAGEPSSVRSDLFAVGRTLDRILASRSDETREPMHRLIERLTASNALARPSSVDEVFDVLAAWQPRRRATVIANEPAEILGRDGDLGAFNACLRAFLRKEDGPRVVVVRGAPGIGKSRLYRELKWSAQRECRVVEGAPRGEAPLRDLLARATSRTTAPRGVDALLKARDELARAPAPCVLAMDGAERWSAEERALLEALLRAARAGDSLLWLLTAEESFAVRGEPITERVLGPLSEDAVREWTAPFVTAARVPDVLRATGGHPQALKELCSALSRGTSSEAYLEGATRQTMAELLRARVTRASRLEARALSALALSDRLTPSRMRGLALSEEHLRALEGSGLVRYDGDAFCLGQAGHASAVLELVEPEIVRETARALAAHLSRMPEGADSPANRSEWEADRTRAVLRAEGAASACALLSASAEIYEWAPRHWVRAAEQVLAVLPSAEAFLAAARAFEAAGDPRRALSHVARAKRLRPSLPLDADCSYRAARCYEKLGNMRRALAELGRARERAADSERARHAGLSSRCLLRLGRYAEAARTAEEAIPSAHDDGIAAELEEVLGLALEYLGNQQGAVEHLSRAAELGAASESPRARARAASYRALHAYRVGDAAGAARGFQEALEIAEEGGLGDLLATSALNLGTAKHQLGDWGAALKCYERGLRAAVAFAKARTEATLRFNNAKLYADIGWIDRAETELAGSMGMIAADGRTELELAANGLRAEIASSRGASEEAVRILDDLRAALGRRGSKRELCEATLHAAEIAITSQDRATGRARLDEARVLLSDIDASDLALRWASSSAELALAEGDRDGAVGFVQNGVDLVPKVSQLELCARHGEVAAEVFRRRSAQALSERHRTSALECWERIATTLPADLAEVFWRNARRAALRSGPAAGGGPRMELVLKLLEVNRRLSSTLDTAEILRLAMDSAIELSGAERGFVLLSPSAGERNQAFEVAVARDLDGERVSKSQLKFSHGIAKRVVASGQALLTIDALADERFRKNASVHGLRLRSIVCVPIRAHGEVLGAVYLDNRFQRGRFVEDDADLIAAFADQIALALHNGRMLTELRERTRALELEQQRVGELMQLQEGEIERLSTELERERGRAEPWHAFPEIVARSSSMQRVLATVQRVADSDVPVTITGESGTGKELIGRAIHEGSSRRGGPFIAINCAAIPEPLLESELFGHVKGAFTGAVRDHGGLFVAARGGTLFLDEIGETPVSVQAKLLRVLQEREVRPVGSDKLVKIADVRIVCATNRNLRDDVASGRFREDLYYRIGVIEIRLPPLRERPEDIPPLAISIAEKMAARQGRPPRKLSPGAVRKLAAYSWPGNVRQLENVVARAVVLAARPEIGVEDIELPTASLERPSSRSRSEFAKNDEARLRAALELAGWNVCEVSRSLGVPRTTLYRKLARYRLLRK